MMACEEGEVAPRAGSRAVWFTSHGLPATLAPTRLA